jgi:hypothetical protein
MSKLLKAAAALGVLLAGNASALELNHDPQLYDACIKGALPTDRQRNRRDVPLELDIALDCGCLAMKFTSDNIGAATVGEMILQLAECRQEAEAQRFYWCGNFLCRR